MGSDVRLAGSVASWLQARFGGTVSVAEPATRVAGGYDTEIWFVRFAGERLPHEWSQPLVLRVHPKSERQPLAEREAAVQEFVTARGYAAPRVLHVFALGEVGPLPVQVMERVNGRTMLDAVKRTPWRTRSLFGDLGRRHAELHRLPTEGWPVPDDRTMRGRGLAEQRLRLVRARLAEDAGSDAGDLAKALGRVERLLPRLEADELSVCHGDFHPMNVLVEQGRLVVIDWTDARLSDRHGDVARALVLFAWVPIAAPNPMQRRVLRAAAPAMATRYLASYERAGSALDMDRVARWEPVHLIHDWVRVGGADATEANPAAAPWLRERLERALVGAGV